MEMLYQTSAKCRTNLEYMEQFSCTTKCQVSSTNILAFISKIDNLTSEKCLNNVKRKLINIKNKDKSVINNSHTIYVCDILSPWYPFKVYTSKYFITVLEWDITGRYLLIGNTEGCIQIWSQKDSLLSEWQQLIVARFPGERVVKAAFFHNGRKIGFSPETREHYLEKYQRLKYSPSVRKFGGIAGEGVLVLCATGLVGAFLIPHDFGSIPHGPHPIQINPVMENLGVLSYLTVAAMSYYGKPNEYFKPHFRIAVSNGKRNHNTPLIIQCFSVSLKIYENKLCINANALPSFFLNEGLVKDITNDYRITHLCWNSPEDSDSLIVAMKTNLKNSIVELWSLIEKVTPIHKSLQANKSDSSFKTVAWTNQFHYVYNTLVTDIAATKVNFDSTVYNTFAVDIPTTKLDSPYIFIVTDDNKLQMLSKDFKKIISTITVALQGSENDQPLIKQPRIGATVISMDCTFFGHLLFCMDNHSQVHAIRLPMAYQEQGNNHIISHITSLFEYAIVIGFDAADVFISIRPNILDSIIDKLTENFQRQPSPVQQYYYVNFLTMKTNLYRLQVTGQSKANDLTSLLMLHSILISFKSILRPSSEIEKLDKGPAENLAMVLAESVNVDVDKVLINLDPKDFTVEPSSLQSLQQLIQWVADLALNLLAKLPQNCIGQNNKNAGYDISKDIVALNSIRELLVMIRIWGILNNHCLPVFSRTVENLDILSTLFRLLTRLSLNINEPDENLLDECGILPSQVLIPQLQFVSTITNVASPFLHLNNLPLQFSFNCEPEFLKFWRDNPPIEGGLVNDGVIDSVRNLMLGKNPSSIRKCLRCGACSTPIGIAKTAAMKAWEQRWATNCRCGGYWIFQKS